MSSSEVIKFNHVITNIGGGYNSSTGIFTAPVSGYYEFIVTIMAQSGNTFMSRVLINGGDCYCHAYGSPRSQAQGMCNVIDYLSSGRTAKVAQYTGSALYGNSFSSFSGHLIGWICIFGMINANKKFGLVGFLGVFRKKAFNAAWCIYNATLWGSKEVFKVIGFLSWNKPESGIVLKKMLNVCLIEIKMKRKMATRK